jgi:hypothetical protein
MPNGTTDYCAVRQIGGSEAFHLTHDFHDDAGDCRFSLRNYDGAAETFTTRFTLQSSQAGINVDQATLTGTSYNWYVSGNTYTTDYSRIEGATTGTAAGESPILRLTQGQQLSDDQNAAQIAFGLNGTTTFQHFISTTHSGLDAYRNSISLFVSDGTVADNDIANGVVNIVKITGTGVGINKTNASGVALDVNGIGRFEGNLNMDDNEIINADLTSNVNYYYSAEIAADGTVNNHDLPSGYSITVVDNGPGDYTVGVFDGSSNAAPVEPFAQVTPDGDTTTVRIGSVIPENPASNDYNVIMYEYDSGTNSFVGTNTRFYITFKIAAFT